MDACLLIRERLAELGLEQKDLAAAAEVTESYVSQLLTRKKSPPAPARTDIYEKMERFLKLRRGILAELADAQRAEERRRNLGSVPPALNEGVRDFVLRRCATGTEPILRKEFEKDAFGPLEGLVVRKLVDVAKNATRRALGSERGVHLLARLGGRSFEETRVTILGFLDTDVIHLSADDCARFLAPWIDSWDFDLVIFRMDIHLSRRAGGHAMRLQFADAGATDEDEPALAELLQDRALCGDVSDEEIAFLRRLTFDGRRPTPLYYYRELQNLRDPLHFGAAGSERMRPASKHPRPPAVGPS